MIVSRGLTKTYGSVPVLRGIDLHIARGRVTAIVGPNGAGKTTLLAALLDGHPLDHGTIRLGHGVVPGYFSQHALELPKTGSVLDATAAAPAGRPRPVGARGWPGRRIVAQAGRAR